MDNENKMMSLLEAILDGQAKLEQGQAKLEQGQAKLEQGQAETNQRLGNLETEVGNLKADVAIVKEDLSHVKEDLSETKIIIENETNKLIRLVSEKQDIAGDKIDEIQTTVEELVEDGSLLKSLVLANDTDIKRLKRAKQG